MDGRILVTGGAGFIGSHLCEALVARGFDVLCVDNLYTGSRRNLAPLLRSPRFEFLRHDVTFPPYVEVDAIFNLARPASPIHYQAPRRCASTIAASTSCRSRWRASSTPMVHACSPMMAGWSPTSSCRRCRTSRSRSMAMASRAAHS